MAGSPSRQRTERGFTLIEVLVALVVVAVGLAAVVEATGHSANTVAALRERTFAQWIGDNVITEYRLADAWETGTTKDERDFAGRTWPVEIVIHDSFLDQVRAIEVEVYDPERPKQRIRTVRGLLVDPALSS